MPGIRLPQGLRLRVGQPVFSQGWYDNQIGVDPKNPDVVWTAGIDVMRSTGGRNWGPGGWTPIHGGVGEAAGNFNSGANVGHVFKTTNGGASWTRIDLTLPDMPVHSIVVHPTQPDTLYIGTDLGVFTHGRSAFRVQLAS